MRTLISIIVITVFFSCNNETQKIDSCLVGFDWCVPNCESPNMAWKFSSDKSFNYSTTLFGGISAWGTWENIGEKKIELTYTKNTSNTNIPNQTIQILDCKTLKIGNTLYKR